MPIEYRFDAENACMMLRYEGEVTFAQIRELTERAVRIPELRAPHTRLSDMRPVTGLPSVTDTRNLGTMVAQLDSAMPPDRAAIVADSDLTYGSTRAYLAARDPDHRTVRLFRTIADAMDWLDLSVPGGDPFAPESWAREPRQRIE